MPSYIELSPDLPFLVVDESGMSRDFLAAALRRLGYQRLTLCDNVLGAYNTLRRQKIGFIFADKFLSNVSGLEFLREIRETPEFHRIPFVLTAVEIDKGDTILANEYGADGVLAKPFVMRDVSKRISTSMANFLGANNVERTYDYARERYLSGDAKAAFDVYRKLIQSFPNATRARVGAARCLRAMGHLDVAEKLLLETLDMAGSQIHALHELAFIYLEMKRDEDAVKAFRGAINASPKNPIRYELAASILMQNQRYAETVDILDKAIKLGLSYPVLYEQLGKSLFHMQRHDAALNYLKLALRADPTNLAFLNSIAICMKAMGRITEAIDYYNMALKHHPDDHRVQFNKALCLIHTRDYARAKTTLERILKIDPGYEKAKAKLAQLEEVLRSTSSPSPLKKPA